MKNFGEKSNTTRKEQQLNMIGAIIGDVVGSRFEFNNIKTKEFELIAPASRFTDDTVLTIAVMDILNSGDVSKENIVKTLQKWARKYPNAGYGGMFYHWKDLDNPKPYNSCGNGSAMRISAVGWFAKSEDDVVRLATAITEVTHNHPEGLKGAIVTAMCIYKALHHASKEHLYEYIVTQYPEVASFDYEELRKTYYHGQEICQVSVPQALYCFLISNDFEDCLRTTISIGGDCDTTSAISCAVAEVYYKRIPSELVRMVKEKLTTDMLNVINFTEARYRYVRNAERLVATYYQQTTERNYNFFMYRNYTGSKPLTLNKIGIMYGYTRERVRQIVDEEIEKIKNDKKITNLAGFFFTIALINLHAVLNTQIIINEDEPIKYLSFDELEKYGGTITHHALAIYSVIDGGYGVSRKYRFVYDKDHSENEVVRYIVSKLKEIYLEEELLKLSEFERNIVKLEYRYRDGKYYRKMNTLIDVLSPLVDENFPNGIHLMDENDYKKFKSCFKEKHGLDCPYSMRNIAAILLRSNYCLIDRGVWKNFDSVNHLSDELLNKIVEYLTTTGGTIFYSTIYSLFENELQSEGITNWFYLKGVLDKQTNGLYKARRANLSIDNNRTFDDPITDYMNNAIGVFSIDDLRLKFAGVKDYLFMFRIYANKDIVILEKQKFINRKCLNIDKVDEEILFEFISNYFEEHKLNYDISKNIYESFSVNYNNILEKIGPANNQFGFYSLCKVLFEDRFDFRRPTIAKKGYMPKIEVEEDL